MPRTIKNLWPLLVQWDHLCLAYQRCRKRKRFKSGAVEFEFDWEFNLKQIQQELTSGRWEPGAYYNFRITDPKPRLISAAPFRDRVVHHAVVGILEPILDPKFIFDSYACRRGKGTHRALKRAEYFARRHPWCLKTDIVKFFPNIDHAILMQIFARRIRDPRLLQLIVKIVDSGVGVLASEQLPQWFPGDDLFDTLRPRGLPIGNLTSQFFANLFLDPIDQFVKEELCVPGYVRYADDLVVFGDSKQELWDYRERITEKLNGLRLKLHPNKTMVVKSAHGIEFLGFKIFPNRIRLSQRSCRRLARRCRQWAWEFKHGQKSYQQIVDGMQSWIAHSNQANAYAIRKQIFSRLRLSRSNTRRRN